MNAVAPCKTFVASGVPRTAATDCSDHPKKIAKFSSLVSLVEHKHPKTLTWDRTDSNSSVHAVHNETPPMVDTQDLVYCQLQTADAALLS